MRVGVLNVSEIPAGGMVHVVCGLEQKKKFLHLIRQYQENTRKKEDNMLS